MKYRVFVLSSAEKELKKLDRGTSVAIRAWIRRNLEGTDDPRRQGKALKGKLKDFWSYRVGQYRLIADISDEKIKIFIFEIGHRSDIYSAVSRLLKGKKH